MLTARIPMDATDPRRTIDSSWQTLRTLPALARGVIVTLAIEGGEVPRSLESWADMLGLSTVGLASALDVLAERGLVSMVGTGRFSLALAGDAERFFKALFLPNTSQPQSAFLESESASRTPMSITPSPETAFAMRERARQARYRASRKALSQREKSAAKSASQRFQSASEALFPSGAPSSPPPDSGIGARAPALPPSARQSERPFERQSDAARALGSARARAPSKAIEGQEKSEKASRQEHLDRVFLEASIDLDTLPPDQQVLETLRRSVVFKRLRAANFRGKDDEPRKDTIPERMCYRISLAPWVTEKIAAFAVWEATELVKNYRAKGQHFNAIGHVISVTGCNLDGMGKVHTPSGAFEGTWRSQAGIERLREQARAKEGAP